MLMLKRSKLKSLKVSEQCWTATKVYTAQNNWTIQGFVEAAIREKINRDTLHCKVCGTTQYLMETKNGIICEKCADDEAKTRLGIDEPRSEK